METPLLAAALIVKNEEKFLPDCLASLNALRPLLSEICVYDTGSTDGSIEIAEAAGARVERGYWDQDFSRARNAAIDLCTSKWVLIVDADERVEADVYRLGHALRDSLTADFVGMDTLIVKVKNMLSESRLDTEWPSMRILRRGRVHYVGHVHEQPAPIQNGKANRSAFLDENLMCIKHFGYIGKSTGMVKGARNIQSADLAVAAAREREPGKPLAAALLDRGRSFLLHGDLERAIVDLLEVRTMERGTQLSRWAGEDIVNTLIFLGRSAEASSLIEDLRREGSDPQMCDWFEAQCAWQASDHERTRILLERVDRPITSGAMTLPLADVVELRMLNALALEMNDDAVASAIRLMGSYGRGSGHGLLLLDLWGDRPLGVLAQLLFEADRGFLRGIAEELIKYPPRGVEVAAALVSLSQQEGARRIGASAPAGASFGSNVSPRREAWTHSGLR